METFERILRVVRGRTAKSAVGSFLLLASARVVAFVTTIVLARILGPDGLGTYAATMSWIGILTIPASLGLPTLSVRLVASYNVSGQWKKMRGLIVRAQRLVLGFAIILALLSDAIVFALSDRLSNQFEVAMIIASLILPLLAVNAVRSGVLRGLHRVTLAQVPDYLVVPWLFVGLVAGTRLLPGLQPTAPMAIALRLAATLMSFVIGSRILRVGSPARLRTVHAEYEMRAWLRAALPLLLVGGMTALATRSDVLLLLALRGAEDAGVYQAAARTADLVVFALVIANVVSQPLLAQHYAKGEIERLQAVATRSARISLAVSLPLAIAFVVLGRAMLAFLMGPDYVRGYGPLVILVGGQIINTAMGPVGQVLTMTGHEAIAAKGMALGVAVNVLLALLLIPRFGLWGAALATALSLVVWNVALAVAVRRRLGIVPSVITAPASRRT